MKTCSYCGKEYPDETTVCPADGETLPGSFEDRKKITGIWRGVYGYGPREKQPGLEPAAFTLKLKQGWLAHFEGSVTDDVPAENSHAGTANGYFNSPNIEFTKQMPVGYIIREDGVRMTFREFLLAEGHACEHELPAPDIFYQGTLLDANRMQGIWTINPAQLRMLHKGLPLGQISGYWCAQFITADLKASPTGGPTEPLFDKSLLSPRELEEVEGVAYVSLGKFNVADSQALLDRILLTSIRFRTARDDEAMQQALPIEEIMGSYAGTAEVIELLVHPEDVDEAQAILNPGEPN